MERTAGDEATYRRLLVPLDGSAEAELALPHAVSHARAYGASLLLIRVVPAAAAATPVTVELPLEGGLPALGALTDDAANPDVIGAAIYLEDVAGRIRAAGVEVEAVVREGAAATTILTEAESGGADLLLIATEVRAGLARLVLGDVADELLRRAPCPIFYVRGEAPVDPGPARRLRNFADDLAQAGAVTPVPLGLREVPLDRIVGSVGRARDLDSDFLPLSAHRRQDERFRRITRAMNEGQALPPIQLYKLGYNYYVLDGHHRVAVARSLGIRELDAEVTEYLSSSNATQQRVFSERREFERRTGLTRVGATRTGTYPRLLEMIEEVAEAERRRQGRETETPAGAGGEDAFKDAARRWYFDFFRPLASQVRKRRLGRAFPGERTADIIVRLRDFRSEEARLGHEVSWERALEHFAAAYDSTHPWRTWDVRRPWDLSRLVPFGRKRVEHPAPAAPAPDAPDAPDAPIAEGADQAERSPPR
jgi:nucleotide-binding universal stress UspA family protein